VREIPGDSGESHLLVPPYIRNGGFLIEHSVPLHPLCGSYYNRITSYLLIYFSKESFCDIFCPTAAESIILVMRFCFFLLPLTLFQIL